LYMDWWLDPELNWGHKDFQSSALPTELSSHRDQIPAVILSGGLNMHTARN
jgi:hypothetical protein